MNDDARLFRLLLSVCRIAGVLTVVLTPVGIWRNQTGVPWWDMWDGYVDFYLRASSGDWSAWWKLHNEHRLLLPDLFFYADLRWFGGFTWLPLIANLAAAGGLWWMLALVWKRSRPADLDPDVVHAVVWIIGVACLSWTQHDNFTVAFQLAFFLSCLVPLTAFVCLAGYADDRTHLWRFIAAALLGTLSSVTLASGVVVPLLLFAFALFLRLRRWQIAVLGLLAVAVPVLYLSNYVAPPTHDSPLHAWLQTPWQALWFVCLFLGGALTQLRLGLEFAGVVGAMMIGALCWIGPRGMANARHAPWASVPAVFLGYAVLTAFATASGRTSMGPLAALAGRYATVSMLALVTALILVLNHARAPWARRSLLFIAMMGCVANLVVQAQTLDNVDWPNSTLRLGQLALSMDVNDAPALEPLYPDNAHLRGIATRARERQLGLFGVWPYRNVRSLIGQPIEQVAHIACVAAIDRDSPVPGQEASRIEGHLADAKAAPYQGFVWLIDADDRIAGLALAGMQRPSGQGTEEIVDNGFIGYATSGQPVRRAVCAAQP